MDDSWAKYHIEARDYLANRKLQKIQLTPLEQQALDLLNQWLEDRGIIAWG